MLTLILTNWYITQISIVFRYLINFFFQFFFVNYSYFFNFFVIFVWKPEWIIFNLQYLSIIDTNINFLLIQFYSKFFGTKKFNSTFLPGCKFDTFEVLIFFEYFVSENSNWRIFRFWLIVIKFLEIYRNLIEICVENQNLFQK